MELSYILVQIRFIASKMKLDIWYSKLVIRVVSRVVKQIKTEDLKILEILRKIFNLCCDTLSFHKDVKDV